MGKTVNIKDLREKRGILFLWCSKSTHWAISTLNDRARWQYYVLAYGKGQTGAVHLQFRYRPQNIR